MPPIRTILLCFAVGLLAPSEVDGAGGTSIIAEKGIPDTADLIKGVAAIVNDPTRTTGWNSWFSEWPNDVRQYAFDVRSMDDVNRLVEKLAAVQADLLQVRLCHLQEPASLGWVTRLEEGNETAVIFSIGDQATIDDWYRRIRKPFGVMDFVAAPVAVPPTLTIFVRNERIKLDELNIPENIVVERGYVPTVFHRSNTTLEKEQEKDVVTQQAKVDEQRDAESQRAVEQIDALLVERERRQPTADESKRPR